MTGFDSIQVRFKNTIHRPSPFANTVEVPFVESYLEVLKSVIDDIKTEYFWFFANFMDLVTVDLDYIPEQHEKEQILVWYNTHPLGGTNKEGNVFLIPTASLKKQIKDLEFLRDYKDINYHAHDNLFQNWIPKVSFKLSNPYTAYRSEEHNYYKWLFNGDLDPSALPNFFPSFWEDEKLYTWGDTNDIMLVPHRDNLEQFYDIDALKNNFGLKTNQDWDEAFDDLGDNEIRKIKKLILKGEDLSKNPRIKISTIHGVKGNERDNVVLFTDLSNAAYNKYLEDPSEEHRLFYVGVTRAKKNLNIIYAKTERGYDI